MPYTMNGIGTEVVPGVGFVQWGEEEDCDAVECFVIFHLPVIPYKALHTFEWSGNQYHCVPIRWSMGLVLRAFARRYLWLPMILAILGCFGGATFLYEAYDKGGFGHPDVGHAALLLLLCLAIGAAAKGGWKGLEYLDKRDANIRWVLGLHDRGSSDPAKWTPEMHEDLNSPQDLFGASSYLDAVNTALGETRFSRAMWAARLAAGVEDPIRGEAATDRILRDPRVRAAVQQVRESPGRWAELMVGQQENDEDEAVAEG